MILTGSQTLRRNFQRQQIPAYLPPLDFSMELEISDIGPDLSFGLSRRNNTQIFNYDLRSGIVIDFSGRNVGTYQSGTNTFGIQVVPTGIVFRINDRLVSNDITAYNSGNPLEQFYIKNNSSNTSNFNLTLNGFIPPTEFLGLGTTDGLLSVTGMMRQSGYDDHIGDLAFYEVFGISVPPLYGNVIFDYSGSGKIGYSITGGAYSYNDLIPVTFDTYFGSYTYDIEITGVGADGNGTSDTGISLNLYGADNLMTDSNSLDFFLDYYSNVTNSVVIELEVDQSESLTTLSGNGEGGVTYQGYVNRTGTIFSVDGLATGRADLFDVSNAAYNTQYAVIEQFLEITKPGYFSKPTYFVGDMAFTYTGVLLQGVYDGPRPDFIGRNWRAYGDVTVVHNFIAAETGVVEINDVFPGTGNPSYSGFDISQPGGGYLSYIADPTMFPTGIGYASILATGTGMGNVTITDEFSFFGSGIGPVGTGYSLIPATGTGSSVYFGNANDALFYNDYEAAYPGELPSLSSPQGDFIHVSGLYNIGLTSYNGNLYSISGYLSPYETTWAVASGPSRITFQGGEVTVVHYFAIANGITGVGPSGADAIFGYTGYATGVLSFPAVTVPGPVFGDARDTTLRPWGGGNGVYTVGSVNYGQSKIFGSLYFTPNSVGITAQMEANPPQVSYEVEVDGKHGVYVNPLTGSYFEGGDVQMLVTDIPSNTISRPSLSFLNPFTTAFVSPVVFTGFARVPEGSPNKVFNLFEGTIEDSVLVDYNAQGWSLGNKLVRPSPEIFPADAASRYLKVQYLSTDTESQGSATLRVIAGSETQEILITGNSNGIR